MTSHKPQSSYIITALLFLHGVGILARPETGVVNWLATNYGLSPMLYVIIFWLMGVLTLVRPIDNTLFIVAISPLLTHTALLWWYVIVITPEAAYVAPIWYSLMLATLTILHIQEAKWTHSQL